MLVRKFQRKRKRKVKEEEERYISIITHLVDQYTSLTTNVVPTAPIAKVVAPADSAAVDFWRRPAVKREREARLNNMVTE